MLAYFPGGALADHFPARKLMSLSLLATAAGGLYMATFPGVLGISLLYGYWGASPSSCFGACSSARAIEGWWPISKASLSASSTGGAGWLLPVLRWPR